MARTEAKTSEAIRIIDYPGKLLKAFYLGKRKVDTKDFVEQLIHEFQKADGTELSAWGFDMLNNKLSTVPKLCQVEITYIGKEKAKNSDNTFHNVQVFYDPEIKLQSSSAIKLDNDDLPF